MCNVRNVLFTETFQWTENSVASSSGRLGVLCRQIARAIEVEIALCPPVFLLCSRMMHLPSSFCSRSQTRWVGSRKLSESILWFVRGFSELVHNDGILALLAESSRLFFFWSLFRIISASLGSFIGRWKGHCALALLLSCAPLLMFPSSSWSWLDSIV